MFVAGDGGKKDIAQFMSETGVTFLNTTVATMAAMLAWLLIERILHGKATSLGAASGIVAGLVAITPSCGAVNIVGAIAIGAIAGGACAYAVGLKFKFNLDDSLDVVGVHLVGGVLGTVLIGFFSTALGHRVASTGSSTEAVSPPWVTRQELRPSRSCGRPSSRR